MKFWGFGLPAATGSLCVEILVLVVAMVVGVLVAVAMRVCEVSWVMFVDEDAIICGCGCLAFGRGTLISTA